MFAITSKPIDGGALRETLITRHAGALVTFEGWVRASNNKRTVLRLDYETHDELAAAEAAQILAEAQDKFSILAACCHHRVGTLEVGDMAVWIGVTSAHRAQAFAACRYIIDEIKHRLPIWKKEYYTDGTSQWANSQ